MEIKCTVCGSEIFDTYYWIVDGDQWHDIWCAECHATHREGERDIPVWVDDEFNNEKEQE